MFSKQHDIGLLLLRLGLSAMMLTHGLPKLMDFAEKSSKFADPFGLGSEISLGLTVFAEVFCSILLIIGLKARWAAIPLAITMAVAGFMIHGDDPFARKEKAFLYLLGYVVILLIGAGKYSLDTYLSKRSTT